MTDRSRLSDVDALRGFALFGILQVNILIFASVEYGGFPPPDYPTQVDRALALLASVFFEGKFYPLFSFLFGYSLTLQMASAERAGEPLWPRLVRRQLALLALGALHGVLLYFGDILTTYAVLGLLLYRVRGWSDRSMIRLGIALIALSVVLFGIFAFLMVGAAEFSTFFAETRTQTLAAYRGTVWTVIQQNATELQDALVSILFAQAPTAFAMFLFGYVAGRNALFARPELYGPWLRRTMLVGMLVGLPGAIFYTLSYHFASDVAVVIAGLRIGVATAPLLTALYVALLLRIFPTDTGRIWRDRLAAAGRMALTNYLMQSLICAFIYHAWGFALIDRLPLAVTVAIACAIFAFQMVVSGWWLRNHAYGPVEWLLRAVTYGSAPRWRTV